MTWAVATPSCRSPAEFTFAAASPTTALITRTTSNGRRRMVDLSGIRGLVSNVSAGGALPMPHVKGGPGRPLIGWMRKPVVDWTLMAIASAVGIALIAIGIANRHPADSNRHAAAERGHATRRQRHP